MEIFICFTIAMTFLASSSIAIDVKNCPETKARLLENGDVKISGCSKKVCTLKRNTDVSIEMKIIPNRDFTELQSTIIGIILDIPIPFPGYDGKNACPNIYDAEGKTKVGCPLKANETYIYKNSFKVLPVYPTLRLVVHWGLDDKVSDAACFEVPAKIVAK